MRRSEIWLISLDPTIGAEIRKTRPAVIVNDDALGYRSVRGDTWFGAQGGNHSTLSSSFRNGLLGPGMPFGDIGFRVAGKEIPEPTTIYLASMGVILLAGRMGRPIANQLRP